MDEVMWVDEVYKDGDVYEVTTYKSGRVIRVLKERGISERDELLSEIAMNVEYLVTLTEIEGEGL